MSNLKRKQREEETGENTPNKKKDLKNIFNTKAPKEASVLPNKTEEEITKTTITNVDRRRITSKIEYGDLTLREFKNMDCDGATIYEGIPSDTENLSLTAMIAHFIIEQLQLPIIGEIYSRSLKPTCVVERGAASHSVRIYGNKQVVVFISEYDLSEETENDLSSAILDFAERHKCRLILSCKGLDSEPEKKEKFQIKVSKNQGEDEEEEELDEAPQSKEELLKIIDEAKKKRGDEKLYFCTNDKDFAEKMIKMEHKPIQDVIVSGVSAGLLAESSYTDITVACLFSKLNELHKFISIDARAALAVVVCISKLLGESVILDISKMDKDISQMEQMMVKVIERLGGGPSSKHDHHLYL